MSEINHSVPRLTEKQEKRFWGKVVKGGPNECWLWTAGCYGIGYGCFAPTRTRKFGAHQVSWFLHNGPIPEGLCVLHNCPGGDNPACVNPQHLWLGTRIDNNLDRDAKGRLATGDRHGTKTHPERVARGERHRSYTHPESVQRGEQCSWATLTEADVLEIRSLRARKECTQRELARRYNLSESQIHRIIHRTRWAHI